MLDDAVGALNTQLQLERESSTASVQAEKELQVFKSKAEALQDKVSQLTACLEEARSDRDGLLELKAKSEGEIANLRAEFDKER